MWRRGLSIQVCKFINFDKDGDSIKIDMDPFSYLNRNEISNNESLRNGAMSFYQLMMIVGVFGVVVSLLVGACKLLMAQKGNSVADAKKEIVVKMFIGIIIFGFVSILGIVFEIASSLN